LLDGKEPALCKHRVESRAAVAFAQDETVALVPVEALRIDAQRLSIEDGKQLRHRKGRADVRALRTFGHVQDVAANLRCEESEIRRRRDRRRWRHQKVIRRPEPRAVWLADGRLSRYSVRYGSPIL